VKTLFALFLQLKRPGAKSFYPPHAPPTLSFPFTSVSFGLHVPVGPLPFLEYLHFEAPPPSSDPPFLTCKAQGPACGSLVPHSFYFKFPSVFPSFFFLFRERVTWDSLLVRFLLCEQNPTRPRPLSASGGTRLLRNTKR